MPCDYKDESPVLRDINQQYGLEQRKALIRYYFGTDPKKIKDIAEQWGQLEFAMKFDGKLKVKEIKKG